VKADLLVNQAFQPFCFFRNRSFEGRSKPPGKPRGYPSTQSSDSIEARNLTEPTDQSKKLFQTPAPTKTPKTQSPKPRWASPSPSEAAIYVRLFGVARTFSQKVQKSQRTRVAGTAAAAPRAYTRGLVCEIGSGEAAKFSPLKMKSVRDFIAGRPDTHAVGCFLLHFSRRRLRRNIGRGIRAPVRKVFSLSHRAAIAAILSPAQAAADLRVLSLGVLLLSVILIPLSQAAWMPAT